MTTKLRMVSFFSCLPLNIQVVKLLLDNPTTLMDLTRSGVLPESSVQMSKSPTSSRNVLIFFVGGYTYAETSALKALQATCSHRFLIAGTNNITGKTLITSVL